MPLTITPDQLHALLAAQSTLTALVIATLQGLEIPRNLTGHIVIDITGGSVAGCHVDTYIPKQLLRAQGTDN